MQQLFHNIILQADNKNPDVYKAVKKKIAGIRPEQQTLRYIEGDSTCVSFLEIYTKKNHVKSVVLFC
jgi:hypothetical protein